MPNEVQDGSDKVERINRGDRTTENTADDGVIDGKHKKHQDIHKEAATAGHNFETFSGGDDDEDRLGQKPGETKEQHQARLKRLHDAKVQGKKKPEVMQLQIDMGDGTVETSKGTITKNGGDGTKLASSKPSLLEQAVMVPHPEASGIYIPPEVTDKVINEIWKRIAEPLTEKVNDIEQMPIFEKFAGTDTSPWRDLDLPAIKNAYEAFPNLRNHGIPASLIGGTILNEIRHRDLRDTGEDLQVKMFGTARNWDGTENEKVSVGPAQMQIAHIKRLAEKYPQLKEYRDDPVRAALDPQTAPFFVAAYFDEALRVIPKEKISVESLAYTYNPDVFSKNDSSNPDDYRSITAAEIVRFKLAQHHLDKPPASLKGWHKTTDGSNPLVGKKSGVVKGIKEAMLIVDRLMRKK